MFGKAGKRSSSATIPDDLKVHGNKVNLRTDWNFLLSCFGLPLCSNDFDWMMMRLTELWQLVWHRTLSSSFFCFFPNQIFKKNHSTNQQPAALRYSARVCFFFQFYAHFAKKCSVVLITARLRHCYCFCPHLTWMRSVRHKSEMPDNIRCYKYVYYHVGGFGREEVPSSVF